MFSSLFSCIGDHLEALKKNAPLVHNITNFVVMNTTANALLAVGASPVMAHAPEEIEEITSIANALVLNIGTLSTPWVESMHRAVQVAVRRGIPVIIDPVGAGASDFRTRTALALLATAVERGTGREGSLATVNAESARTVTGHSPHIVVRGNASEILALAGTHGGTKGVESTAQTLDAVQAARAIAMQYGCVVCVSGAVDLVTDGSTETHLVGGSALMAQVTGMGCTASALIGGVAGLARPQGLANATISAMAFMSTAGGMAAKESRGPGSFLPAFLDALYVMTADDIRRHMSISQQPVQTARCITCTAVAPNI